MRIAASFAALTTLLIPQDGYSQLNVQNYAQSFNLAGITANQTVLPGTKLNLRLITDQIPNLERVEIIQAPVDLTLIFRHLTLTSLTDNTPIGPFPSTPATRDNPTAPIEAWVATITGNMPIGHRVIQETPTIEVRWTIIDANNQPFIDGVTIDSTSPGNDPLALTLLLAPRFRQWSVSGDKSLTEAVAGVTHPAVKILAEIRVRTVSGNSGWTPIPQVNGAAEPITIQLPDLPVPDIMAMFEHPNFGGGALVSVPSSSPLGPTTPEELQDLGILLPPDISEITALVNTLVSAVSTLKTFARFTPLADVLEILAGKLPGAGPVVVKAEGRDLHNINAFIEGQWFDDDWGDKISSLAGIAPDKRFQLFEHDNERGDRLSLRPSRVDHTVTAIMKSLHSSRPSATPAGVLIRTGTPESWRDLASSFDWDR